MIKYKCPSCNHEGYGKTSRMCKLVKCPVCTYKFTFEGDIQLRKPKVNHFLIILSEIWLGLGFLCFICGLPQAIISNFTNLTITQK